MYHAKFLVPVFLGTAVYVCISILFGPDSILVSRQLEKQKHLLYKNTQKIEFINENLSMDYLALRVDAEVIAGHAKRLGYIHEGENLIKLSGIAETKPLTIEAGTPIVVEKATYTPEWVCKLCGLLTFLVFCPFFYADSIRNALKKRRQVAKEQVLKRNAF